MRTAIAMTGILGLSWLLSGAGVLTDSQGPHAQETSGPRPVVPEKVIQLRNNSKSVLEFYIAKGAEWRHFRLEAAGQVELPYEQAVVAIATAQSKEDVAAFSPPAAKPDALRLKTESQQVSIGPHFIRLLEGGQRWEFCWQQKPPAWIVQRQDEKMCQ